MKVIILGSGKSYHATRWANSLADKGVSVAFATSHKLVRPLSNKINFVQLSERGAKGYLLDVFKLRKFIADWQPDLLHVHFSTGYGFLGKLSGFGKRIVSIYGTDIYEFPQKSTLHKAVLAFNLSGADAILSTSECMAEEYLKVFPDKKRPVVTPFGVDTELFKPQVGDVEERDCIKIGIVKKLEDKYGIDILINAFSVIKKRYAEKEIYLKIVGEGTKLNQLKAQVGELGLDKEVSFLGAIDNKKVPEFLSEVNIFVVPSRSESESFGVAAVEAQACAVPVVVSNVGGLPEVVAENKTGLVFKNENVESLVDAIEKLIESPSLRQKLGEGGRARVLERYDWSKNVDQMIRIYQEVVSQ